MVHMLMTKEPLSQVGLVMQNLDQWNKIGPGIMYLLFFIVILHPCLNAQSCDWRLSDPKFACEIGSFCVYFCAWISRAVVSRLYTSVNDVISNKDPTPSLW